MKHLFVLLALLTVLTDASGQNQREWSRLKGPNVGGGVDLQWGPNGEIIALNVPPYGPVNIGYYISKDNGGTWNFIKMAHRPIQIRDIGMLISQTGEYYFFLGSDF